MGSFEVILGSFYGVIMGYNLGMFLVGFWGPFGGVFGGLCGGWDLGGLSLFWGGVHRSTWRVMAAPAVMLMGLGVFGGVCWVGFGLGVFGGAASVGLGVFGD